MNGDERSLFVKNVVLIIGAVIALTVMLVLKSAPKKDTGRKFSRETIVDGIQLSGLSFDDAKQIVSDSVKTYFSKMNLSCRAAGRTYELSGGEFIYSDVDDVMESAYEACESNIPADECVFYTHYTIDTKKLRDMLSSISAETNVEPVEPSAVFNSETKTFSYTDGVNGISLDIDASLEKLVSSIEREEFGTTDLVLHVTKPERTIDDLKENTVKIAQFSSVTTNNYNRNKNIQLMCEYVDGCCIAPGDVLSINELVGERTIEKGFLAAPAIMDGKRTVDDIGGGICQMSGTLFNAALLANMKIIERWPHSWPSDYLDVGLDSTLDWNTQKDLKIQNPTDYNMYISAWLEGGDLSASNIVRIAIYGKAFPEGVTVKIHSEITETTLPPAEKVTYTSTLYEGQSQVLVKARIGYKTRVWREFFCDGVLLDSEIVSRSVYSPIRGERLVGNASRPTQTPTPTPIIIEPPQPTEPPYDG